MEINFYQIDDLLYKSIAPLLLKILEENKKALVFCRDEQNIKMIDDGLWSFSKTKFVPHATQADKLDPLRQPVFISDKADNTNKAEYLIMTDPVDDDFLQQFNKVFYFFEVKDLDNARRMWTEFKKKSFNIGYYKKEDGKWIKVSNA